ncbi:hypothetical protein M885DRAFT_546177 [Pelagophyceae sp. CCMP2097]|nr:hypothetical protein M885DRAFT_546177 [Pelagophyceae sp. CCMP2097]|mmetsp:Transcript_31374/g.105671  ORF Transcript_31374/g.105671 Transcript_31374/m.105671 type:complete len:420 (-) Transcript_31374:8-1267(-)
MLTNGAAVAFPPAADVDDGACLLGVRYGACSAAAMQEHLEKTLWLTYRCGFPEMTPYGFTDDAGWGCMLRSSQMLFAAALRRHLERRTAAGETRDLVLKWFADAPGDVAVYSIHNMVRVGLRYDMLPGEWYGPGISAIVLRDLCEMHESELDAQLGLRVLVTSSEAPLCEESVFDDMTSYRRLPEEDAEPECEEAPVSTAGYDPLHKPPPTPKRELVKRERDLRCQAATAQRLEQPWNNSLIVLVPLRLGLAKLEAHYLGPLVKTLNFPQSLGFVGGRPRQACYFVGCKRRGDDKDTRLLPELVALDPHTVQPSPSLGAGLLSEKHLESVKCTSPRLISPSSLDPSLALGFYCAGREEFVDLCARLRGLGGEGTPILVEVIAKQTANTSNCDESDSDDGLCDSPHALGNDELDDEYVVI